jgi:RNA polymerase sigma-54 factor
MSARFFIDAIQSRRKTLLKVMNAIVDRQTNYFFSMGDGLKPMYEKDIAEDINYGIYPQ